MSPIIDPTIAVQTQNAVVNLPSFADLLSNAEHSVVKIDTVGTATDIFGRTVQRQLCQDHRDYDRIARTRGVPGRSHGRTGPAVVAACSHLLCPRHCRRPLLREPESATTLDGTTSRRLEPTGVR